MWADTLAIASLGLVLVILLIAFAWPWWPHFFANQPPHHHYVPVTHGGASTQVVLDDHREPVAWSSDNLTAIAAWEIFDDPFPENLRVYLLTLIPELGTHGSLPPGTMLFRSHNRTRFSDGTISESDTFLLRDREADQIVGVTFPGIDYPFLYDPALDATISPLAPSAMTQQGIFASVYSYTLDTQQHALPASTTPFGTWEDCRELSSSTRIAAADSVLLEVSTLSVYCAGHGMVQTTRNSAGSMSTGFTLFGQDSQTAPSLRQFLPPPAPFVSLEEPFSNIDAWEVTVHAILADGAQSTRNSIAPTYVAVPRPFVLVATRNGPLVALDARHIDLRLWQFQTGGSIHTQPSVDPATGIIYVGSSDKRVYAITEDGLFLWRFELDDNVIARPLVIDDLVIAVAEDGTLAALDKITGKLRWQRHLGSATVTSPIHVSDAWGNVVALGSEAGELSARAVDTGELAWRIDLGAPIRVPLAQDNGLVYAATASGSLFAIDSTGVQLWRTVMPTHAQSAPAVNDAFVFVVDEAGWLTAYHRVDGSVAWRSGTPIYTGTPLWLNPVVGSVGRPSLLIVATSGGALDALTVGGKVLDQWTLSAPEHPNRQKETRLAFGLTAGGGMVWISDHNTSLYRLGLTPSLP